MRRVTRCFCLWNLPECTESTVSVGTLCFRRAKARNSERVGGKLSVKVLNIKSTQSIARLNASTSFIINPSQPASQSLSRTFLTSPVSNSPTLSCETPRSGFFFRQTISRLITSHPGRAGDQPEIYFPAHLPGPARKRAATAAPVWRNYRGHG